MLTLQWNQANIVSKLITLNEFLKRYIYIYVIKFINFNAVYLSFMQLICRIVSKNIHCIKSILEHLMLLINILKF